MIDIPEDTVTEVRGYEVFVQGREHVDGVR